MPVRMSGADYKAFMEADWGPNACWDDEIVYVDGVEIDTAEADHRDVADTAKIVIEGGYITPDQDRPRETVNAENFARRWIKSQTIDRIVIEVPKGTVKADLLAHLRAGFPTARVL